MNYVASDVSVVSVPARKSYAGHLRPAVTLIVLFTMLTGVAFPLLSSAVGRTAFPFQAGGA